MMRLPSPLYICTKATRKMTFTIHKKNNQEIFLIDGSHIF